MKSKHSFPNKFFLVLAFIYAVSIGTAAAQPRGRLIVMTASDFGRSLVLVVRLDGRTVANLLPRQRFDRPVWTGRRILSVAAAPNTSFRPMPTLPSILRPASAVVDVRPGRTYAFTAEWRGRNRIVLVPERRW